MTMCSTCVSMTPPAGFCKLLHCKHDKPQTSLSLSREKEHKWLNRMETGFVLQREGSRDPETLPEWCPHFAASSLFLLQDKPQHARMRSCGLKLLTFLCRLLELCVASIGALIWAAVNLWFLTGCTYIKEKILLLFLCIWIYKKILPQEVIHSAIDFFNSNFKEFLKSSYTDRVKSMTVFWRGLHDVN